jgi:uncharacterized cysteine cluster protein YcgN (CxxCxxCC family)
MARLNHAAERFGDPPFWKSKSLQHFNRQEWESICTGCGICCLHRFYNRKTGKTFFTSIACRFLDPDTCRCIVYKNRFQKEPDCEKITPGNLMKLKWLPRTCGYRRIAEGKDLDRWHPLISGDPETVHQAGVSMRRKVVPEQDVRPGDVLRYMIRKPSAVLFYDFC